MKQTSIFLLSLFALSITYAQEKEPDRSVISSEDYRKIAIHLQTYYNVPKEVYSDSIDRIQYQVEFQIDEEGYIRDPKITHKTLECKPCEQELFKVMKRAPKVNPAVQNGRKIKSLYTLPFNIQLP